MSDGVNLETMKFSEAMTELEQIVRMLEGGQLELEESLKRYERGVALIGFLQSKLANAEQQVSELLGQIQPSEEDGEAEAGEDG